MRSGKDTVARLLAAYGFQRLAFADRLKELATELFGMSPDEKNRDLLVALGRRMCELDKDVWVKHVLARMPTDERIVITDMRFPPELELLRGAGFYIARVECPERMRLARLSLAGQLEHADLMTDPSETALDGRNDWDFRLNGATGIVDLTQQVAVMAREMLEGELS